MYDCIIIGAGPAGISASLYLTRAGFNTLVLYNDYGALAKAEKIENFYGAYPTSSGLELAKHGIAQTEELGTTVKKEEVLGLNYNGNFLITTTNGEYSSKALLIATGSNSKPLNIKGIEEFTSKGISYCAVCDGFLYKNKEIAVIGASKYALHELDYLRNLASKVYLLTDNKKLDGDVNYPNVEVIENKILEITGNTRVEKIILDGKEISIDGIFVANDTLDANQLAKKIYVETEKNLIKVNETMETNIPGIFAAGDCTQGIKQISKAVFDGTKAAYSIIKFLKK